MSLQSRSKLLIHLLAMLVLGPMMAQAQDEKLPPVSNSGFLGYYYGLIQSSNSDVQTHTAQFNWNFSSYIKQPYIARYFGIVNVSQGQSTSAEKKSTRTAVSGNLTLRVFPQSNFPLEVFVRRASNQQDDTLGALVNERTAYGLTQRYTSKSKTAYALRLLVSQQVIDDRVEGREQHGKSQDVSFGIKKSVGKWSLNWRNDYLKQANRTTGLTIKRINSIFRHSWRPAKHMSMNGFTTYRDSERQQAGKIPSSDRRLEFNNYLFWRPNTPRRMVFNSALRHVELLANRSVVGGSGNRATTLSGGVSYQLNERLGLSASATGLMQKSAAGSSFSMAGGMEARYVSKTYLFGSFRYQWNTALSANADGKSAETEGLRKVSTHLGHSVSKVFFPTYFPLSLRLSQQVAAIEGSDQSSTQQLNHQLSLNWSRSRQRYSQSANFSVKDLRSRESTTIAGEAVRSFQLATLLFSQFTNISQTSRFSGSASVQLRKQSSRLADADRNVLSGSADLTYLNSTIFNTPGLQFRSTLRWYSTSFISSADDLLTAEGTQGLFWENRMQYRLGQLTLDLTARVTSVNGVANNSINFRIRRHFDATFFN